MQAEHVDGLFIEMEGAANFALLEAMHQAGMNVGSNCILPDPKPVCGGLILNSNAD